MENASDAAGQAEYIYELFNLVSCPAGADNNTTAGSVSLTHMCAVCDMVRRGEDRWHLRIQCQADPSGTGLAGEVDILHSSHCRIAAWVLGFVLLSEG